MSEPVSPRSGPDWLSRVSWGVAILMVALMIILAVRNAPAIASAEQESAVFSPTLNSFNGAGDSAALPGFQPTPAAQSLVREANPRTVLPTRMRMQAIAYTIKAGDSLFSVATRNQIKPESILWSNYDTLTGNPDMIEPGVELVVPPTDGVYYKWCEGDTLESVAIRFKAQVSDIIAWPGNRLDMTDPQIKVGDYVMVPGGQREFHDWLMPTIPQGKAGVALKIPGTCDTGDRVVVGGTNFIWPTANHSVSGNDFWSGHLALDIGAGLGDPIVASESGVVVFAGGASNGYGRMVMIDHGNGFQTLYAHLSEVSVRCGQQVKRGQLIGAGGSTGNSTGPHLHFEVRRLSGLLNPRDVLPPP